MIIDTSAIISVIRDEDDAAEFARAIDEADHVRVAAPTLLETCLVVDRDRNPLFSRALDRIVHEAGIEVVDFGVELAAIAREAYRLFGRGSGHRARLNFGDCFSYALAYATDEPLLFKGDDFVHTDVKRAV